MTKLFGFDLEESYYNVKISSGESIADSIREENCTNIKNNASSIKEKINSSSLFVGWIAGNSAFSCNIHFDTHFPFSGNENTAYGKFEGRMHYVKTVTPSEGPGESTTTIIALDARYGVCNLQIVPSNLS